jgi:hypothetical protein
MNKKELIRLIQTKSREVEIKDFSSSILDRVRNLPQREMIEAPKRTFRLKPILFATLGTLASVLLFMVLYNPASPIIPTDPITPSLQNMDEVIALSAVSTASLVETFDAELSINDSYTLSFGNPQDTQRIRDEIKDVTKYMETIEKLFASESNFNLQKENITAGPFTNRMRFKTKDLLGQEASYKFDYSQVALANPKHFDLDGELEIGEKQYHITGKAETDTNQLMLKAEKDSSNYIIIHYEVNQSIHQFTVEIVKNDETIQKVQFDLEQSETSKKINLQFIEGESIGTYEFQIEENDNVKIIKAKYHIVFDEEEEKGEFILRVLTILNNTSYSILIKPEGKPPFIITQNRVMTERRPRFQTSLENVNL